MVTEEAAFADDAWQDFTTRLRAYVRRRLDPAWADDVFGDVLLRLVRHRADLRAAENPSAWVFRVAANVLADHHRRRGAEHRALARAGVEPEVVASAGNDEDEGAAAELSECLIPLLRGLPAPYSEALLLTEVEGLSQIAAAKRLGVSLSGMKSRVQRGRVKLKEALLRCCAIEIDRRGHVLAYAPQAAGCGSCGTGATPLTAPSPTRSGSVAVRRPGRSRPGSAADRHPGDRPRP